MANTRVKEENRKLSKTHSIKRRIAEEFEENMKRKGLCPSNVVEELIDKYNKEQDND